MKEEEWTPTRVEAANAFCATHEKLDREVYGLGVLLHVLNWRYSSSLPWLKSWEVYRNRTAATMGVNQ
jgi:hypothetical protein